jgi:NitT/TauT family transport system permease protein
VNYFTPYKGFYTNVDKTYYIPGAAIVFMLGFYGLFFIGKLFPERFTRERIMYLSDVFTVAILSLLAYEVFTNRFPIFKVLKSPIFPSLNQVMDTYHEDLVLLLWDCTTATLGIVMVGWLTGIIIAAPLGIFLGWSKYTMGVINPFLRIANAVPVPTWIPILIVAMPTMWWSMSMLLFIGTFFAVLNNTILGIRNIDRRYVEAGEMLGSTDRQILWRIAVPFAMPNIFSGILTGWILCIMLVIIAEMIGASKGIGWYLMYTRGWGEYRKVIAGMLWSGIIGLAGYELVRMVESRLLRWRVGIVR